MNIAFVEVKNFRKLKSCRIELSKESTIFVGANNSGKTSAMLALIKFLKNRQLLLDDFTISNLPKIAAIGASYADDRNTSVPTIADWSEVLPSLDVWLNVDETEVRYVADIIPTLSWNGGLIGIRLIFEPKDPEKLYSAYVDSYKSAQEHSKKFHLWPNDLCDFLSQKIGLFFTMNAYILDEAKLVEPDEDNTAHPQTTPYGNAALDFDPFKNLIRIDIIAAQRGLEDSENENSQTSSESSLLSSQLRDYYDRQLDPEHQPTQADIKAISELQGAKEVFDRQISKKFEKAMKELSTFGYPGKNNPRIIIESKAQTSEILSHSTVVRYPLFSDGTNDYKLPEKYNGLGYQNLISMSFKLMSFRDSWINGDKKTAEADDGSVEVIRPIHLVLIEEPEAHLHAQVQQVFIKNAYKILRNHPALKKKTQYSTQMIVTTHSSYIALESDFSDLRYFRRIKSADGLPISVVANMSEVFGKQDKTTRFVSRYLKTTHCDLFFADAAILIEGTGERIFMPYFIKNKKYQFLDEAYLSILDIGGRYAYLLKPLIDKLGIMCLVITDLDSADPLNRKSKQPQKGANLISSNPTISNWVINNSDLDYLLALSDEKKHEVALNVSDSKTRIAYQMPVSVTFSDGTVHEFIPTTFEDALAYDNFHTFKTIKGNGLIAKFRRAFKTEDYNKIAADVFNAVESKGAKKAEFALDMIYSHDPEKLAVPAYIASGLNWLQNELITKEDNDFLGKDE